VNSLLADNKRNLRKQVDDLTAMIDKLKSSNHGTEELQEKIQQLQTNLSTKEEIAEREKKKIQKESESKITELTAKLETITKDYTSETLIRAITDAAVTNKAYAPEQIVGLLRGNARIEEELGDDDKPTGRRIPKVRITVPDEDGKNKELDLTVSEAVKVMRETPAKYANLFMQEGEGGLGMQGFGRGGREPDLFQAAKTGDLAKYRELKKKKGGL